jgi:hypothetical protein
MEYRQVCAYRLQIGQLMARQQEAHAQLAIKSGYQRQHFVYAAGIKAVERLVEQDELGIA